MNELIIYQPGMARKKKVHRYLRYFLVLAVLYGCLALLVFLYLQKSPVYRSHMAIVIPGSGSSSSFNIDNVGQANQQTKVAFDGKGYSPLANYKIMLTGRTVLDDVGLKLGINDIDVLKPRVELRNQSSIIDIYSDSSSSPGAKAKNWAIYDSFQKDLQRLRSDEMFRRDQSIKSALDQYRLKVAETRRALVLFQENALVVSKDQMDELVKMLSEVKGVIATKKSLYKNLSSFVSQLGKDLVISPELAGKALIFQSDATLTAYWSELNDSAALIAQYSSKWGAKHPKVLAQKSRYDKAFEMLRKRSAAIVGIEIEQLLLTINVQNSPERAKLFADLMASYAKLQGIEAEIKELEQTQRNYQDKLRIYAREVAELEELEREHNLAEAVFTSAAARLEAGKSDVFASYPVVQLLQQPSQPIKARSPSKKIALIAFVLGFIIISIGVFILWQRHFLIAQVLKMR